MTHVVSMLVCGMEQKQILDAISVDHPSNRACWEDNPALWKLFCDDYRGRAGWKPGLHELFTEAYCVQWFDTKTLKNKPETTEIHAEDQ